MNLPKKRSNPSDPINFGWIKIKLHIKLQLMKSRTIGMLIIRLWRIGKALLLRCKWKIITLIGMLTRTYSKEIDVDKVYWISSQRIIYDPAIAFPFSRFKGHVIGGNWDSFEKRFEDLDIYIALKEVFTEHKNWADTVFYKRMLERLDKGEILWGCRNKQDFDRRCDKLEDLFNAIKAEGYKSQKEISSSRRIYDPEKHEHEITLSIGRYGDLFFSDGAHRLAMAKLLNVTRIPIQIVARHPEWVKFKKEILMYAEKIGGKTYQPLPHPDLEDVPAFHDCEDRLDLIKENMSSSGETLLDIGANLGYFCHKFEKEGFNCYAVEDSQVNLYFLKKLKRAENKEFNVIDGSILEWDGIKNIKFDVILALNIFHHFLKTKLEHDKFIALLKNLKGKELFFESHRPDELETGNIYRNYSPDEFVELLLKNTGFSHKKFIGTAKDGRRLYRLY